jgi:heterodisulfide reductase subunit B
VTAYAYYPGCSLESSAKEYDSSIRASFKKLGIELKEIPDWSCCGSSPTHKVDKDMTVMLSGRNLALAKGIGDVVAPCASCSLNLKEAVIELEHDSSLRGALKEAGVEYMPGSVSVVSAVEAATRALDEGAYDGVVANPLTGLKVASYYGCMLVRPPKLARFDDPENPTSMDRIMEAVGAAPVDWSHKTECCGNSAIMANRDMTLNLISNILNAATAAGADIVATSCPLCQLNLAARQTLMRQKYGLKAEIPVVYFSQLVGAALGITGSDIDLSGEVLGLIKKRQSEAQAKEVAANG